MVEALAPRGMGVPPMKHGQDARATLGFYPDWRPATRDLRLEPQNLRNLCNLWI